MLSILYVGETIGAISQLNSYDNVALIAYSNKQEAVNALTRGPLPDAILFEHLLSDRDGIEWHEQLRGNTAFDQIPFILLVHEFNEELFKTAFLCRIDDFFVLPLPPVEGLIDRLIFLKHYRHNNPASQPETIRKDVFQMPVEKRIFDLVVAFGFLWILSPILLLAAIAIRLESQGPVYYKSVRFGRNGKIFNLFKFRTTRQDSIAYLKKEIPVSDRITNAPRVTQVGRILQDTGIDKLLQLINVIKGDMSIVGNDPLHMCEAEQFMRGENAKHFLAPVGIISLWQVVERRSGPTLSETERIRIENAYADQFASGNYHIWDDLALIFRRFL